MEEFSTKLSNEEMVFYQQQILAGNTRPLDMIYRTINPQVNTSGAIKKAIQKDQQTVGIGTGKKSTKAVESNSSFDDDLSSARKKNDFRGLIKKHLL